MNELMTKINILFRAEKTLLKAEAQRRSNSIIMTCMGLACVLIAIVFVNLGLFFYFSEAEMNAKAAFWLAALNLLISVVPFVLSQKAQPSNEEMMVREIRDMAVDELSREADMVSQEVNQVVGSVKQLTSSIGAIGSGGGSGFSIGAALPLVNMLIDLMKRKQ